MEYFPRNQLFYQHHANIKGRDFVVGDIHGEFSKLQSLLNKVRFDHRVDRLFSVGDLVDRGPESNQVLDWLMKKWFYAVRGNHDHFCVQSGARGLNFNHYDQGGVWFFKLDDDERADIAYQFSRLPIALEVMGKQGQKFGFVHAECVYPDWAQLVNELAGNGDDDLLEELALDSMWQRGRICNDKNAGDLLYYRNNDSPRHNAEIIASIDQIFVGHSTVKEVYQSGNVTYMDTGACYREGHMSLMDIHSREIWTSR